MNKLIVRMKHEQIKDFLKKELLAGKHLPGGRFPSQNELAAQFNVSPVTARVALAALVQDGFLTRIQGKGTFINDFSRTMNSKNLGLVIHHSEFFDFSFFMGISRGVNMVLEDTGFHSLLIPFKEEHSRKAQGKSLTDLARRKKLEGLMIMASQVDQRELLYLQEAAIPFVLINCFWPGTDFDFVCPDFFKGSYLLAEHLIGNGYEPIIYFGGYGDRYPIEKERISGYRKALDDYHIKHSAGYEILLPLEDWDKAYRVTGQLDKVLDCEGRKSRTGILFGTDLMAYELNEHLRQKGYRIPEDVGMAGGGNLKLSERFRPPLTTVEYGRTELGRLGAEMLLNKILHKKPGTQIFLEPKLIVRQSSGKQERNGKPRRKLECMA